MPAFFFLLEEWSNGADSSRKFCFLLPGDFAIYCFKKLAHYD
jgi:hypothetical protein